MALLAGFAVMALLVIVITALLTRLVPSWTGAEGKPQPGYVVVNLGYSFLAAAAGGYVTAWAAAANPLIHVLALALVVLLLAALSALQSRGKQPIWYQLALVAISPIGVLAGGLVRLRVLGIL
jgi:NADH:ubiquinone oxidoreductase subunit 6 (subunit J)